MVQGILVTCFEAFGLVFSLMTGVIYDQFTTDNGTGERSNVCYGTECFWRAWLILLDCSLMASTLPLLLLRHFKKAECEIGPIGNTAV